MPYVVTDNCIKCKYTDCVEVCPVDCFYEGINMLVIDPSKCIDCGVCEPECPSEAIVPDSYHRGTEVYLSINAFFSGAVSYENTDFSSWPAALVDKVKQARSSKKIPWRKIVRPQSSMSGANNFRGQPDKINDLDANSA